jgi:CDP-glucose 4,6-dehydratase
VHEAQRLNLATDKAFHLLQWQPVWNFAETIAETVTWYREVDSAPANALAKTRAQIAAFSQTAHEHGLAWAA